MKQSNQNITASISTLLVISSFAFTGCSTIPSATAKFNQSQNGDVQFVDFPSERRGAWFVKVGDGKESYRVCAEPPTDTGLSTAQLLNITAGLKKSADASVGLDSNTTSNLYELKGRTPAVLALRDVMYRMCEGRLYKKDVSEKDWEEDRKIYKSIVDIIGRFAEADLQSAVEQKERVIGVNSKVENARAKEQEGIAAVGKKNWGEAKQAFDDCEATYPSYRACYEFSNALKASSDSEKAKALLKKSSFLPNHIRNMLEELAQ